MSDINPLLLTQRPTNSPYRYAAYEFWKRLKWDLHPESWRSRRNLNNIKDNYLNKKAVIICNGPSLLQSNFSLLEGVFTFGLNKINLLFNKSSFRPSCIVSVNQLVVQQNSDFYNETEIPLFINSSGLKLIQPRNNVTFLHTTYQCKFAKDCSFSLYHGYTVTFIAMQLAYHMGFKKVALIGCDHNFSTKGASNKEVISGKKDENHFDPNYFAGGVKWQLPDLLQSEVSYNLAKEMYESTGRRILNCTSGGYLEIFPRMLLEDFIKS